MFAIAFDLVVADIELRHPRGVSQAYTDIGSIHADQGLARQGSLYVNTNEDMAKLFPTIPALRTREWLQKSVRDIRAFRVEQWSDFTAVVKSG